MNKKQTIPAVMGRLSPFSNGFTLGLAIFVLICLMPNHAAPVQETGAKPYANEKGCYFLNKHYVSGDEIETNDPCMNCSCTGSAMMCYLRMCPFIKPLDGSCKIQEHKGDCCPKYWCPKVYPRVSTPTPDTEGKGCSVDGSYYEEGARLPVDPFNPCHACYCIRNVSVCTTETCELHIPGCYPSYKIGNCCPERYTCTEDAATTIPPTSSAEEIPPGCDVGGVLYGDGDEVPSNETCKKCYCMRHQVMCTEIECTAPGTNCVPHEVLEGQCCPERYDCPEGTEIPEYATTHMITTEEEFLNLSTTHMPPTTPTSTFVSVFATDEHLASTVRDEKISTLESETMYPTTKGVRRIDDKDLLTTIPILDAEISTSGIITVTDLSSRPRIPKITEVPDEMFTTVVTPKRTIKPTFRPIPGEGNCRFEGRLYQHGDKITPKDPCLVNCTCISSGVECDRMECVLTPPQSRKNCKVKVEPDECCPIYVCDTPRITPVSNGTDIPQQEIVVDAFSPTPVIEQQEILTDSTEETDDDTIQQQITITHIPVQQTIEDTFVTMHDDKTLDYEITSKSPETTVPDQPEKVTAMDRTTRHTEVPEKEMITISSKTVPDVRPTTEKMSDEETAKLSTTPKEIFEDISLSTESSKEEIELSSAISDEIIDTKTTSVDDGKTSIKEILEAETVTTPSTTEKKITEEISFAPTEASETTSATKTSSEEEIISLLTTTKKEITEATNFTETEAPEVMTHTKSSEDAVTQTETLATKKTEEDITIRVTEAIATIPDSRTSVKTTTLFSITETRPTLGEAIETTSDIKSGDIEPATMSVITEKELIEKTETPESTETTPQFKTSLKAETVTIPTTTEKVETVTKVKSTEAAFTSSTPDEKTSEKTTITVAEVIKTSQDTKTSAEVQLSTTASTTVKEVIEVNVTQEDDRTTIDPKLSAEEKITVLPITEGKVGETKMTSILDSGTPSTVKSTIESEVIMPQTTVETEEPVRLEISTSLDTEQATEQMVTTAFDTVTSDDITKQVITISHDAEITTVETEHKEDKVQTTTKIPTSALGEKQEITEKTDFDVTTTIIKETSPASEISVTDFTSESETVPSIEIISEEAESDTTAKPDFTFKPITSTKEGLPSMTESVSGEKIGISTSEPTMVTEEVQKLTSEEAIFTETSKIITTETEDLKSSSISINVTTVTPETETITQQLGKVTHQPVITDDEEISTTVETYATEEADNVTKDEISIDISSDSTATSEKHESTIKFTLQSDTESFVTETKMTKATSTSETETETTEKMTPKLDTVTEAVPFTTVKESLKGVSEVDDDTKITQILEISTGKSEKETTSVMEESTKLISSTQKIEETIAKTTLPKEASDVSEIPFTTDTMVEPTEPEIPVKTTGDTFTDDDGEIKDLSTEKKEMDITLTTIKWSSPEFSTVTSTAVPKLSTEDAIKITDLKTEVSKETKATDDILKTTISFEAETSISDATSDEIRETSDFILTDKIVTKTADEITTTEPTEKRTSPIEGITGDIKTEITSISQHETTFETALAEEHTTVSPEETTVSAHKITIGGLTIPTEVPFVTTTLREHITDDFATSVTEEEKLEKETADLGKITSSPTVNISSEGEETETYSSVTEFIGVKMDTSTLKSGAEITTTAFDTTESILKTTQADKFDASSTLIEDATEKIAIHEIITTLKPDTVMTSTKTTKDTTTSSAIEDVTTPESETLLNATEISEAGSTLKSEESTKTSTVPKTTEKQAVPDTTESALLVTKTETMKPLITSIEESLKTTTSEVTDSFSFGTKTTAEFSEKNDFSMVTETTEKDMIDKQTAEISTSLPTTDDFRFTTSEDEKSTSSKEGELLSTSITDEESISSVETTATSPKIVDQKFTTIDKTMESETTTLASVTMTIKSETVFQPDSSSTTPDSIFTISESTAKKETDEIEKISTLSKFTTIASELPTESFQTSTIFPIKELESDIKFTEAPEHTDITEEADIVTDNTFTSVKHLPDSLVKTSIHVTDTELQSTSSSSEATKFFTTEVSISEKEQTVTKDEAETTTITSPSSSDISKIMEPTTTQINPLLDKTLPDLQEPENKTTDRMSEDVTEIPQKIVPEGITSTSKIETSESELSAETEEMLVTKLDATLSTSETDKISPHKVTEVSNFTTASSETTIDFKSEPHEDRVTVTEEEITISTEIFSETSSESTQSIIGKSSITTEVHEITTDDKQTEITGMEKTSESSLSSEIMKTTIFEETEKPQVLTFDISTEKISDKDITQVTSDLDITTHEKEFPSTTTFIHEKLTTSSTDSISTSPDELKVERTSETSATDISKFEEISKEPEMQFTETTKITTKEDAAETTSEFTINVTTESTMDTEKLKVTKTSSEIELGSTLDYKSLSHTTFAAVSGTSTESTLMPHSTEETTSVENITDIKKETPQMEAETKETTVSLFDHSTKEISVTPEEKITSVTHLLEEERGETLPTDKIVEFTTLRTTEEKESEETQPSGTSTELVDSEISTVEETETSSVITEEISTSTEKEISIKSTALEKTTEESGMASTMEAEIFSISTLSPIDKIKTEIPSVSLITNLTTQPGETSKSTLSTTISQDDIKTTISDEMEFLSTLKSPTKEFDSELDHTQDILTGKETLATEISERVTDEELTKTKTPTLEQKVTILEMKTTESIFEIETKSTESDIKKSTAEGADQLSTKLPFETTHKSETSEELETSTSSKRKTESIDTEETLTSIPVDQKTSTLSDKDFTTSFRDISESITLRSETTTSKITTVEGEELLTSTLKPERKMTSVSTEITEPSETVKDGTSTPISLPEETTKIVDITTSSPKFGEKISTSAGATTKTTETAQITKLLSETTAKESSLDTTTHISQTTASADITTPIIEEITDAKTDIESELLKTFDDKFKTTVSASKQEETTKESDELKTTVSATKQEETTKESDELKTTVSATKQEETSKELDEFKTTTFIPKTDLLTKLDEISSFVTSEAESTTTSISKETSELEENILTSEFTTLSEKEVTQAVTETDSIHTSESTVKEDETIKASEPSISSTDISMTETTIEPEKTTLTKKDSKVTSESTISTQIDLATEKLSTILEKTSIQPEISSITEHFETSEQASKLETDLSTDLIKMTTALPTRKDTTISTMSTEKIEAEASTKVPGTKDEAETPVATPETKELTSTTSLKSHSQLDEAHEILKKTTTFEIVTLMAEKTTTKPTDTKDGEETEQNKETFIPSEMKTTTPKLTEITLAEKVEKPLATIESEISVKLESTTDKIQEQQTTSIFTSSEKPFTSLLDTVKTSSAESESITEPEISTLESETTLAEHTVITEETVSSNVTFAVDSLIRHPTTGPSKSSSDPETTTMAEIHPTVILSSTLFPIENMSKPSPEHDIGTEEILATPKSEISTEISTSKIDSEISQTSYKTEMTEITSDISPKKGEQSVDELTSKTLEVFVTTTSPSITDTEETTASDLLKTSILFKVPKTTTLPPFEITSEIEDRETSKSSETMKVTVSTLEDTLVTNVSTEAISETSNEITVDTKKETHPSDITISTTIKQPDIESVSTLQAEVTATSFTPTEEKISMSDDFTVSSEFTDVTKDTVEKTELEVTLKAATETKPSTLEEKITTESLSTSEKLPDSDLPAEFFSRRDEKIDGMTTAARTDLPSSLPGTTTTATELSTMKDIFEKSTVVKSAEKSTTTTKTLKITEIPTTFQSERITESIKETDVTESMSSETEFSKETTKITPFFEEEESTAPSTKSFDVIEKTEETIKKLTDTIPSEEMDVWSSVWTKDVTKSTEETEKSPELNIPTLSDVKTTSSKSTTDMVTSEKIETEITLPGTSITTEIPIEISTTAGKTEKLAEVTESTSSTATTVHTITEIMTTTKPVVKSDSEKTDVIPETISTISERVGVPVTEVMTTTKPAVISDSEETDVTPETISTISERVGVPVTEIMTTTKPVVKSDSEETDATPETLSTISERVSVPVTEIMTTTKPVIKTDSEETDVTPETISTITERVGVPVTEIMTTTKPVIKSDSEETDATPETISTITELVGVPATEIMTTTKPVVKSDSEETDVTPETISAISERVGVPVTEIMTTMKPVIKSDSEETDVNPETISTISERVGVPVTEIMTTTKPVMKSDSEETDVTPEIISTISERVGVPVTEILTTTKPVVKSDSEETDVTPETVSTISERVGVPVTIAEDKISEEEELENKEDCIINGTSYKNGEAITTIDPCEKCHCSSGEITCLKIICKRPPKDGCIPSANSSSDCCASSFECPEEDETKTSITTGTRTHVMTEKDLTTPIPITFMFSTSPTSIASTILVTKFDEAEKHLKESTEISTVTDIESASEEAVSISDTVPSTLLEKTDKEFTLSEAAKTISEYLTTETGIETTEKTFITIETIAQDAEVTGAVLESTKTTSKEDDLTSTFEEPVTLGKDAPEKEETITLIPEKEITLVPIEKTTVFEDLDTSTGKEIRTTEVTKQPTETPTTFDTIKTTFVISHEDEESSESTTSSKIDEITKPTQITTVSEVFSILSEDVDKTEESEIMTPTVVDIDKVTEEKSYATKETTVSQEISSTESEDLSKTQKSEIITSTIADVGKAAAEKTTVTQETTASQEFSSTESDVDKIEKSEVITSVIADIDKVTAEKIPVMQETTVSQIFSSTELEDVGKTKEPEIMSSTIADIGKVAAEKTTVSQEFPSTESEDVDKTQESEIMTSTIADTDKVATEETTSSQEFPSTESEDVDKTQKSEIMTSTIADTDKVSTEKTTSSQEFSSTESEDVDKTQESEIITTTIADIDKVASEKTTVTPKTTISQEFPSSESEDISKTQESEIMTSTIADIDKVATEKTTVIQETTGSQELSSTESDDVGKTEKSEIRTSAIADIDKVAAEKATVIQKTTVSQQFPSTESEDVNKTQESEIMTSTIVDIDKVTTEKTTVTQEITVSQEVSSMESEDEGKTQESKIMASTIADTDKVEKEKTTSSQEFPSTESEDVDKTQESEMITSTIADTDKVAAEKTTVTQKTTISHEFASTESEDISKTQESEIMSSTIADIDKVATEKTTVIQETTVSQEFSSTETKDVGKTQGSEIITSTIADIDKVETEKIIEIQEITASQELFSTGSDDVGKTEESEIRTSTIADIDKVTTEKTTVTQEITVSQEVSSMESEDEGKTKESEIMTSTIASTDKVTSEKTTDTRETTVFRVFASTESEYRDKTEESGIITSTIADIDRVIQEKTTKFGEPDVKMAVTEGTKETTKIEDMTISGKTTTKMVSEEKEMEASTIEQFRTERTTLEEISFSTVTAIPSKLPDISDLLSSQTKSDSEKPNATESHEVETVEISSTIAVSLGEKDTKEITKDSDITSSTDAETISTEASSSPVTGIIETEETLVTLSGEELLTSISVKEIGKTKLPTTESPLITTSKLISVDEEALLEQKVASLTTEGFVMSTISKVIDGTDPVLFKTSTEKIMSETALFNQESNLTTSPSIEIVPTVDSTERTDLDLITEIQITNKSIESLDRVGTVATTESETELMAVSQFVTQTAEDVAKNATEFKKTEEVETTTSILDVTDKIFTFVSTRFTDIMKGITDFTTEKPETESTDTSTKESIILSTLGLSTQKDERMTSSISLTRKIDLDSDKMTTKELKLDEAETTLTESTGEYATKDSATESLDGQKKFEGRTTVNDTEMTTHKIDTSKDILTTIASESTSQDTVFSVSESEKTAAYSTEPTTETKFRETTFIGEDDSSKLTSIEAVSTFVDDTERSSVSTGVTTASQIITTELFKGKVSDLTTGVTTSESAMEMTDEVRTSEAEEDKISQESRPSKPTTSEETIASKFEDQTSSEVSLLETTLGLSTETPKTDTTSIKVSEVSFEDRTELPATITTIEQRKETTPGDVEVASRETRKDMELEATLSSFTKDITRDIPSEASTTEISFKAETTSHTVISTTTLPQKTTTLAAETSTVTEQELSSLPTLVTTNETEVTTTKTTFRDIEAMLTVKPKEKPTEIPSISSSKIVDDSTVTLPEIRSTAKDISVGLDTVTDGIAEKTTASEGISLAASEATPKTTLASEVTTEVEEAETIETTSVSDKVSAKEDVVRTVTTEIITSSIAESTPKEETSIVVENVTTASSVETDKPRTEPKIEQEADTATPVFIDESSPSSETSHRMSTEVSTPTSRDENITEFLTKGPKSIETTTMQDEEDYLIDENTCIFEGRIFQSAEQIPRTDPCEFCFCFRGDIICLQQSCPPPAPNCNQTMIPGYCCPRYECPVYLTSKNMPSLSRRKGSTPIIIQKRIEKREIRSIVEVKGCQINGTFYELGKTVTSASGPCLHCVCQADGFMHCDPQRCKPEAPLMLKMNSNYFRRRR